MKRVFALILPLSLLGVEVPTVIVTANKLPQHTTTEDVTVITKEEIEEKGFTSLKELLEYLVGAEIVANGGVGKVTSFYLRGMDSNKVLILIDGIRYNDPSNIAGASLEHLLLDGVERVEIIKGAQSGVWGSSAASGVINIITSKKGKREFSLEGGSFVTKKVGVSVGTQEPWFYFLSYNYFKTDGFSAITPYNQDPRDFEADGYRNQNAKATLGYEGETLKATLGAFLIDAKNEADGYDPSTFSPDPNSKNDDKFKYNSYFATYLKQINNHKVKIKASFNDTKRKFLDTTWGVKQFEGKYSNVELQDQVFYPNSATLLGVGYDKYESSYQKVDKTKGDIDYSGKYLFLDNVNYSGNVIFTQNFRYDDFDAFKDQLTGKLGIKYNLRPLSIFFNVGKAYNVPNQIKMINPWGVSNFDLDPEKTTSFDSGFELQGLKAVYFLEKVKNLIEWYDPNPNNFGDEYYTNIAGTSKFKGVEVSYSTSLDNSFLELGFTYLDPKDSKGNYLPRRAKTKYTYSLTSYLQPNLALVINGYYVGKRWDDPNKTIKTGSYNVTNLTTTYSLSSNLKLSFKVKNLFDRKYQEVYNYGVTPRSYYLSLKANF